jgi:group I intron endonuclease
MSKRKDISGIYKITSPSGKIYIGRSYRIKERWRSYKRMDCKDQNKLFSSFAKYGTDNHNFEIIHQLPNDVTKDIIENYESLYYKFYNDCGFEFLNLAPTGKGVGKLKDCQIKKAGDIHKGKSTWTKGRFGKDHNRSKEIICNGTIYGSISEASRKTGISISTIHYSISMNKCLKSGMHFQLSKI